MPTSLRDANLEALRRLQASTATLVGLRPAREVVPALADRVLLHSGPPVSWARMCGPQRGAVIGAALFEGWARTPEEAERLAARGDIAFSPCHHHRAVGPMAGVVSGSMALYVVRNETFGTEAYSTINMGLGRVLRFGAYDASVLERLAFMNGDLARVLDEAIRRAGGVDVRRLIAEAVAAQIQ